MNLIFQTFNYFPMYAPGNHLLIIKYYIDKMMDKILLKCPNHFQILFDKMILKVKHIMENRELC